MTNRVNIKLTANFERNLADIEQFLTEAEAPQAFDGLIDELLGTVLPNLERFPELGSKSPSLRTIFKLCTVLEINPSDMIDTVQHMLRVTEPTADIARKSNRTKKTG